ncbi:MAG: cytochrome C554, partial [Planctomycetota bacterium]
DDFDRSPHSLCRRYEQSYDEWFPATTRRNRLRVMFVAGLIADVEFSMRATGSATEKARFGVTSAKRTARAIKRLNSAAKKVGDRAPQLQEIMQIATSVKLRLNNRRQLTAAADEIATLGYQFAQTTRGENLQAIDAYIPPQSKWK